MLEDTIEQISNEFIAEAQKSPRLLEDMASMEKYMAESYGGRVFFELLQNADDAKSTRVLLTCIDDNIIFANNGRPFSSEDVVAISRSGASTKKRGTTIGYRGVGFKSATCLSNEIAIYSDDVWFSFSKSICAQYLNTAEEKVPVVRIPFLTCITKEHVQRFARDLVNKGYTTVFVFSGAEATRISHELSELSIDQFLFLNHISNCSVELTNIDVKYLIKRQFNSQGNFITLNNGIFEKEWLLISNRGTSIAVQHKKGKLMPCESNEAVFHCFLPTQDKSPFLCKINGDFSTDPSRKHLVMDEATTSILHDAAKLVFDLICKSVQNSNGANNSGIFELLTICESFSKFNIEFRQRLKDLLEREKWIPLNNGELVSASAYPLLPSWLEPSEQIFIRTKSKAIYDISLNAEMYKDGLAFDSFIASYSNEHVSTQSLIAMMEDKEFVGSLSDDLAAKIYLNIAKSCKSEEIISGNNANIANMHIRTSAGIVSLKKLASQQELVVAPKIVEEMKSQLSTTELSYFIRKTGINEKPFALKVKDPPLSSISSSYSSSKTRISRWKSAEMQCLEIEELLGNTAEDVSQQNVGYDVISKTKSGETRYIEVKLVAANEEFSITNNEYTAAHQFGNQYYICLIVQRDNQIAATYIRNPLKTAKFEKRVRQWEWLCLDYEGEQHIFEL